MPNPEEKYLIDNLIPSPALFYAKILWGNHSSLNENIKELKQTNDQKEKP